MTGLITVVKYPQGRLCSAVLRAVAFACAMLMIAQPAQALDPELELQTLASERSMLTDELEQYKSTVKVLSVFFR